MKKNSFLLVILGFAILQSGCASIAKFLGVEPVPPTVTIKNIVVERIDLTQIDLQVVIDVKNSNQFDLKISELDYKIFWRDAVLGLGEKDEVMDIVGEKTQEFSLPLTFQLKEFEDLVKTILKLQPVKIEVKGSFKYATFVGDFTKAFELQQDLQIGNLGKF
jgi:LEA14-like dessication related protein